MLLVLFCFFFVCVFFLCVRTVGFGKALVVSLPFLYLIVVYFLSLLVFLLFDINSVIELHYYDVEFLDSGFSIVWMAVSGMLGVYLYLVVFYDNYSSFMPRPVVFSSGLFYVAMISCFLMYLLGGEWEGFLYRDSYIERKEGVFYLLGSMAVLILPVFLGGICCVDKTGWGKIVSLVGMAIVLLIYFSKGSKGLALAPFLYWFGLYFFSNKGERFPFFVLLSSIAFLPVLYSIAIISRQGGDHGLLPYINTIMNYDGFLLSGIEVFLKSIASNFYVFSETLHYSELHDLDSLLVMINPLPGSMVGWYDLFDAYRVHKFIPFSALGEIFNYGFCFSFLYFLIVGLLFSRLMVRFFIRREELLVFMIPFIMMVLFVVFSYSYNLRSITRYLYYMVFFEVLARFFVHIVRKRF